MDNNAREKVFEAWRKIAGASLGTSVLLFVGLMQIPPEGWNKDPVLWFSGSFLAGGIPLLCFFLISGEEYVTKEIREILHGGGAELIAAIGILTTITGFGLAMYHFNKTASMLYLMSILLCLFILFVIAMIVMYQQRGMEKS